MTDADAPLFEDPAKEKAARDLIRARARCREDVRSFTERRENAFWGRVGDVQAAGVLEQGEIAHALGVHRDTVRVRVKQARDARAASEGARATKE